MGKKMAVRGHTAGGQEGGGRLVGTYENNWLGMVCWTIVYIISIYRKTYRGREEERRS